jgi:hypothetical protein
VGLLFAPVYAARVADFVADPRRDAFAVIRGFTFQVERSIAAWLALESGHSLLLEAGEDVDYVRGSAPGLADSPTRLLEQIKYRSRPISLRSPAVVDAIANYIQRRERNPDASLTFRYVTNGRPTRERKAVLPDGLAGIDCWTRIGQQTLEGDLASTTESLKDIVLGAARLNRPDAVAYLEKTSVQAFGSEVIANFEFCFLEHAETSKERAIEAIQSRGLGASQEEAEAVFVSLFSFVLTLLGQAGEKKLDPANLTQALSTPHVGQLAATARLLTAVQAVGDQLASQEVLLSRIDENTRPAAIAAAVRNTLGDLGPALPPLSNELIGTPPPVPAYNVPSPGLEAVRALLNRHRWVGVSGVSGSGKSQLARQIQADWREGATVWASLFGQVERLPQSLLTALQASVEDGALLAPQLDLSELLDYLVAKEEGTTLLVLDDVPDCRGDKVAEEAFALLASRARQFPIRILSTSQFEIGASVRSALGADSRSHDMLPFGVEDVRRVVAGAGAPATIVLSDLPAWLEALTDGHPQLLSAAIYDLAAANWSRTSVGEVLADRIGSGAKQDAQARVRRLIAEPETRALLDRLSLVPQRFSLELVDDLAGLTPPIDEARARMLDLKGPWATQHDSNDFELAPQLRGLGRTTLSLGAQRRVDAAIAQDILRRRVLSPSDVFAACNHLERAGQSLQLAGLYLKFLIELGANGLENRLPWLLHFFPADRTWPREVPRHVRISIRASQLTASRDFAPSRDALEKDLETLIASATNSQADLLAVAHARLQSVWNRNSLSPDARCRAAIEMARAWKRARMLPQGGPEGIEPAVLWWAGAMRATSAIEHAAVVQTLKGLSTEEVRSIFAAPEGPPLAVLLLEWFYADVQTDALLAEAKLHAVNELAWLAEVPDCQYLNAIITRVRALILSDHLGRIDEAIELLMPFAASDASVDRFIGSWTAARILASKQRDGDALYLFVRAIACSLGPAWMGHRFDCVIHGATCALRLGDTGRAETWLLAGVREAAHSKHADSLQLADLYGELALLRWRQGSPAKAAAALRAAAAQVQRNWDENHGRAAESLWKIGHISGWVASIARTGGPPKGAVDGGRYVEPEPGFALCRVESLGSLPTPGGIAALLYQVGMVFAGCLFVEPACRAWRDGAARAGEEQRPGLAAMALAGC